MGEQLSIEQFLNRNPQNHVVNVSSVPQRSPFRYPGGKTWLIPTVRDWLKQETQSKILIEPFAGGGIVSLTAAFENLVDRVTMVELDEEVASVWKTIINGENEWLANKILQFDLTTENVNTELSYLYKDEKNIAFCTILKNRVFHGGILAKGSGMLKHGENGKGISSRWYAKTLAQRIRAINDIKHKIEFVQTDAFKVIEEKSNIENAYFFIDPPYTIAGKRLYKYFEIDHERLFNLTSKIQGRFMLTYDDTKEIRALVNKYGLKFKVIPMKTTHHLQKNEIIISDNFDWQISTSNVEQG